MQNEKEDFQGKIVHFLLPPSVVTFFAKHHVSNIILPNSIVNEFFCLLMHGAWEVKNTGLNTFNLNVKQQSSITI